MRFIYLKQAYLPACRLTMYTIPTIVTIFTILITFHIIFFLTKYKIKIKINLINFVVMHAKENSCWLGGSS